MAHNTPPMPNILRQPPSVDFIDNELPKIHGAFKNLPVRYDPMAEKFVGVRRAATMPVGPHRSGALHPGSASSAHSLQLSVWEGRPQHGFVGRKLPAMVGAMKFWKDSGLFQRAMASFVQDKPTEPKKLIEKPEYSIRRAENWDEIWQKLAEARNRFDSSTSKWKFNLKQGYRALADKTDDAQLVMDLVPDSEYVTPVKAVVGLLLEAVKNASNARQKATQTFDDTRIQEIFAKVDEYLAAFPEDEVISESSVNLVACVFKAAEAAIAYFLSSTLNRALKSMPLSSGQALLLDTIDEIDAKVQKLADEANTSHIIDTREVRKGVNRMESVMMYTANGVTYQVQMTNVILQLLNDGAAVRDKLVHDQGKSSFCWIIIEKFDKIQGELEELRAERIQQGSSETPEVQTAIPTPPPQQLPWQPPQPLPWYPAQYMAYPPPSYPPPYYYIPQQQAPEPTIPAGALLNILGAPDLDWAATNEILSSENSVSLRHRSHTNRVVATEEFHAWAISPHSRELLIQGDPAQDVTEAGPALTLLSATITHALQNQERFVPLVFFCAREVQLRDAEAGPTTMMRSLTAQLLHQYYANSTFWQRDVDIHGLQTRRIDALCLFFKFLVRHVARQKTIACVIDGVGEYENAKHSDDLRTVLDCLLGLVRAEDVPPAVKVLVTCHTGTVEIHNAFSNDSESFLSLEGFTSMGDEGAILNLENEF
ncbi:hypothetical protein F4861DRAFT_550684 [Xylaria intraflava]|nr:hypothetical protein F4861DRAFT_550684 [Xylaria intraflava]